MYLSADNGKVAFDLWGGMDSALVDQWDIYVDNADGSTTKITNDSYEDSYPQLSSDGQEVVFTSLRQGANGGNSIVVRSAINLDEETAQVHATTDPIPQIIEGVPLRTRHIRVSLNRPNFTLNPTNCDPFAVNATLFGPGVIDNSELGVARAR